MPSAKSMPVPVKPGHYRCGSPDAGGRLHFACPMRASRQAGRCKLHSCGYCSRSQAARHLIDLCKDQLGHGILPGVEHQSSSVALLDALNVLIVPPGETYASFPFSRQIQAQPMTCIVESDGDLIPQRHAQRSVGDSQLERFDMIGQSNCQISEFMFSDHHFRNLNRLAFDSTARAGPKVGSHTLLLQRSSLSGLQERVAHHRRPVPCPKVYDHVQPYWTCRRRRLQCHRHDRHSPCKPDWNRIGASRFRARGKIK